MYLLHKSVCENFILFVYKFPILIFSPGSRFTETNNFGFVALDILYCYPEDSGTYTCRAKNIIGEAVTSANLVVHCELIMTVVL
jgi:hypothetical protein